MKKIFNIIIICLVIISISTISLGVNTEIMRPDITGDSELTNIGKTIIGIVQIIATAVAICMLLVLAIKYMISSTEEKAAIKQRAIPLLIGAILIFGIVGLLQIIKGFATQI